MSLTLTLPDERVRAVADAQRRVAAFASDALRYLALDHIEEEAAEAELLANSLVP